MEQFPGTETTKLSIVSDVLVIVASNVLAIFVYAKLVTVIFGLGIVRLVVETVFVINPYVSVPVISALTVTLATLGPVSFKVNWMIPVAAFVASGTISILDEDDIPPNIKLL
jgi:hypothetical protein